MTLNKILYKAKLKISVLIIGLMGLMILNNVIFLHSHVTKNGIVVVHAHPYQSNNDSGAPKNHQHSQLSYFFFDHFQLLFYSAVISYALYTILVSSKIQLPSIHFNYSRFNSIERNKAPPAVLPN